MCHNAAGIALKKYLNLLLKRSVRLINMTNKPRLAILGTRGIPARYGGFESFAEELAIRLVDRGIDVTVFCEDQDSPDRPDSYRGVRLVHVKAPSIGPLSTIIFDLKCLWLARTTHDFLYMLGYGAALFCFIPRLWGKEVWINMDGVEWSRAKWNWIGKLWLRFMERAATWTANRLIADAAGISNHLRTRYARLPEVTVIPYGAYCVEEEPDGHALEEFGLIAGEYYLIVCRLEPENHIREILEGFIASDSEFPIVIVGDSGAQTKYVRALKQLDDQRIRFIGTVYDRAKLESLRWHCRAYFHGHSVGGTNPSLLEALGCGNRVIAHENVFNREVAGECADFFSSPAEISKLVNRLEGREVLAKSRSEIQNRVRENYNWEKVTGSYLELLGS
jgi:glycosyltransferase involved in cell wall biosynthesis